MDRFTYANLIQLESWQLMKYLRTFQSYNREAQHPLTVCIIALTVLQQIRADTSNAQVSSTSLDFAYYLDCLYDRGRTLACQSRKFDDVL